MFGVPKYTVNTIEGFVASSHLGEVEVHLLQHFGEDDV
jgi:hypothetical protein